MRYKWKIYTYLEFNHETGVFFQYDNDIECSCIAGLAASNETIKKTEDEKNQVLKKLSLRRSLKSAHQKYVKICTWIIFSW